MMFSFIFNPLELNKLLIIVVVLSMALTPLLNYLGQKAADIIGEKFGDDDVSFYVIIRVVILKFSILNFIKATNVVGVNI